MSESVCVCVCVCVRSHVHTQKSGDNFVWRGHAKTTNLLNAIHHHKGMRVLPDQGPEFHDRQEAGQIQDLSTMVLAIDEATQVEYFGPITHLCPESLLESLFRISEGLGIPGETHHPYTIRPSTTQEVGCFSTLLLLLSCRISITKHQNRSRNDALAPQ